MPKVATRHPHDQSSRRDERLKYEQGEQLAILAIILFAVFEAWAVYVFMTIKPDLLAYQYFRLMLEVPMMFFFYFGHKWALWLLRIGFALGAPLAVFLCVLLIHKDRYLHVVPTAAIPIAATVAGCWILFGSESFLLHFKHKRHARSIYD